MNNFDSNRRLLVIDDNHAIHQDFAKVLCTPQSDDTLDAFEMAAFGKSAATHAQNHFEIDSAFQGQEGLEKVRTALAENRPYAMAFVDIRMPPGWDGIETTMKIWEIQPDLQIVICTAYSDYCWDEMIAKLGHSDQLVILKKPFDNIEAIQLANAMTKKWLLLKQTQLKVEEMEQTIRSRTAELHDSCSEMETVFASVSSAIIGLDREERVIRWNSASERLFGVPPEKVLTQPLSECGMQWNWALIQRGINECRQDRHVVELDDVEYRNISGKNGFVNIVLTPTLSDNNKTLDVVLLATDITHRRSIEVQLRQAQKLKVIGQLAAGIAHELNTPAQYIGDNTRFLKDAFASITSAIQACNGLLSNRDHLSPELLDQTAAILKASDLDYLSAQIPSAIDEALEGVERVSEIVRAMKDFSHPGTNEKIPSDLNKAIESTVTVSRSEWKYVADMTLELDKTLPCVPCLVGEFNQVVLNLIVNAGHAIEEANRKQRANKGRITIKTCVSGQYAEVRVSDTGTGIPESARPKLFEPFFTTKDVGKGTGQGLFIAHNVICEKHGGTIHFETQMGAGTTFVIRLPLAGSGKDKTVTNEQPVSPVLSHSISIGA